MDTANLTLAQIIEQLDKEELLAKNKLDAIREKKRNALSLLNGEQELSLPNLADAAAGRSTGLTPAVLSVLERKAKDKGITFQDVTNELLAQDFKPRGKKFSTSVYTTLNRLHETKRANLVIVNGVKRYSHRNGHE